MASPHDSRWALVSPHLHSHRRLLDYRSLRGQIAVEDGDAPFGGVGIVYTANNLVPGGTSILKVLPHALAGDRR